jgi:D-tyrosyl-tRNA(Tyr) deacylase
MIALIQRVSHASVSVDGATVGQIGRGVLALVCAERNDTEAEAAALVAKLIGYRIFPDEQGRMNRSLVDLGGGLLLVPQFTLAADTQKGTRPGFSTAAEPAEGQRLFDYLADEAHRRLPEVQTGRFGAHMRVSLTNDGPVTFWLRVPPPATG